MAHSVRQAEAPLKRSFIVMAVGELPPEVETDLQADGLRVRPVRDNETLASWETEWVIRPENSGCWFKDRGLLPSFAQLAAWSLQEFDRLVLLDADTLMLENCDELFQLGRTAFAASPEIHTDQEDYTRGGGKVRTYLINAGVLSIRPNAGILKPLRDAMRRPDFRMAVEKIGVFGVPNFQSLIDMFMLDQTHRHGMALWSPSGFEGCFFWPNTGLRDAVAGPALGRPAPASSLSGGDHCLLPMDYNFYVDFPHAFQAAFNFREAALRGAASSAAGSATWNVPRQVLLNATVAWIRKTGLLRDKPKIVHFPGLKRKPWQRYVAASRSPWDELWWRMHAQMCARSAAPCRIRCKVVR